MNEKEFIERVKKELLAGYYPGENGKPERLPADYVEELIQKKTGSVPVYCSMKNS